MELKKKPKKPEGPQDETGVLSQLLKEVGSDNEQEEETKESQELRQQQAQEERKAEQEACESFMNLTFTQIIQRVFENKIFPCIAEIVERVL